MDRMIQIWAAAGLSTISGLVVLQIAERSEEMARTGRPRGFDRERAITRAMVLFWDRGYETTSLSDLRLAMGISSASFYAAFGSKEGLYREALQRYVRTHGRVTAPLDDEALEPRDAIEGTLRDSARMQTDPANPAGCLLVLSANVGAPENHELRRAVATEREHDRHRFEACVRRAVASGALARATPVTALATLFETCLLGLSIQAVDGVPADRLQEAITQVMAAWDACRPPAD